MFRLSRNEEVNNLLFSWLEMDNTGFSTLLMDYDISYANFEDKDSILLNITSHGLLHHLWKSIFRILDAVDENPIFYVGDADKRVSTGLLVVSAALATCNTVHVFGLFPFGCDKDGNRVSYHYWEVTTT